jgi:hypothetical protein
LIVPAWDPYLKGYHSMRALFLGLTEYFEFYNHERPHQSLSYKTPAMVYKDRKGGGARIVDKFKKDLSTEKVDQADETKKISLLTSKTLVKKQVNAVQL